MVIVDSSKRAARWIRYNAAMHIRRILLSSDPETWVEYISAAILIGIAAWFFLRQGRPTHITYSRFMPFPLWIAWTMLVGSAQACSTAWFNWHIRAAIDSLAALYWGMMSIQMWVINGFTALHPTSIVMSMFCGLIVFRYFWRSERGPETVA